MSAADDADRDDPPPTFRDPPTMRVPLSPELRAASRRSRPPAALRKATLLSAVALADRAPPRRRGSPSRKATLVMGSVPEPHPDERPTTEMRVVEGPRLDHAWFDGAHVAALPAPHAPPAVVRRRRRLIEGELERRPPDVPVVPPSRLPPAWVWIALLCACVAVTVLVGTMVAAR